MTSYLLPCWLCQNLKMSRFKVFQYEISNRTSYLRIYELSTIILKIYEKILISIGKNMEKNLAFFEFSLDFQSENGYDLTKDGTIEMRGSQQYIEKMFSLPSILLSSHLTLLVWEWNFHPHENGWAKSYSLFLLFFRYFLSH